MCICVGLFWMIVVSLLGHPHYQTRIGRHGWFPSTIGHVGSWKKIHNRVTVTSWCLLSSLPSFCPCLLPCCCSAQCLYNVMSHFILWKGINLDILSGWVNTSMALNLVKYVKTGTKSLSLGTGGMVWLSSCKYQSPVMLERCHPNWGDL